MAMSELIFVVEEVPEGGGTLPAHSGNRSSQKRTRWLNCRGKSVRRFAVILRRARRQRLSASTMCGKKSSPYEASPRSVRKRFRPGPS